MLLRNEKHETIFGSDHNPEMMNFIKSTILVLSSFLIYTTVYSQSSPFKISLEPINISGLGGIQSYAFGQANGKWLIVGGRLDGLHRRQPFAAFDIAGNNNQLVVVDPVSLQKWSAPLSSLPTAIKEQLSSTNMQFYQEGDYLYCFGGYGFSATANDHTTYDKLTAIKIADVIDAIINGTSFTAFFRQITDSEFQVTGGRLQKINETYYLLGGQKFIGRYNPMGPTHGPGFIQEYTNAIRKFKLIDNDTSITITHLSSYIDSNELHRRDYNAVQQILPNGNEGISMFSGVFQQTRNLPFLNSVTVDSNNYAVNNSFQQYYNHYHCPVLPIYSEKENEMHTVFFGGIAQFYDSSGTLVQDDNVPFVNTIARVTRDQSGNMTEHKLPVEMPSLLGAGAEFIPNLNFPHFKNEVFKFDSVSTDINDSTLIGYIYGGISSTLPKIFFINNGTQSNANDQLFKVFIRKTTISSLDEFNGSSVNNLNLLVYPNPNDGKIKIAFKLDKKDNVTLTILDLKGAVIDKTILSNLSIGDNYYEMEIPKLVKGGVYFISLETSNQKTTHKLVIRR